MAISDLHCVVGNDQIAVVWAWDNPTRAWITVTRLLDGKVLNQITVSKDSYNRERLGPNHGPLISKVDVPIQVTVESEAGEKQETQLLENKYIVEWCIVSRKLYRKRLFRQEQVGVQQSLVLNFPCEGTVPDDLFYYSLAQGGKSSKEVPVGYLPALKSGRNVYGLLPTGGRSLVLYCNPKHDAISRLFDFKQLPNRQLPDMLITN